MKEKILKDGFAVFENIFTNEEVDDILSAISEVNTSNPTFRKTADLFAIRQFLNEVPASARLIFNVKLNNLIADLFGDSYFVVKSIYFDKPENSNWFVSYHQDLTISVDKKLDIFGYGPWTKKVNQFSVQPPLDILEDNFAIRIHLDDTDEENGALKIIPKSHSRGICRPEMIDLTSESETICRVPKGGVMFMKPLLLHASSRSVSRKKRRVIHIEFSRSTLPKELHWAEFLKVTISN